MIISDDRNAALGFGEFGGQGSKSEFSDEGGVAGILGIHGESGVSRNGFWAGGGDGEKFLGRIGEGHTEMIEKAFLLFHNDLLIGKSSARDGTPVDHPASAIDQLFLKEIDKDLLDAGGVGRVHSKAFARPVAGCAEFFELLNNDSTVFFFPLPNFF